MSENTHVAADEHANVAGRNVDEATRRTTVTPSFDIFEDAQAITLLADLPGVPRDKLDIRVHDGSLSIEAEAVVATPAHLRFSHAEAQALLRTPLFARRFVVSDDFDTSRIEANLKDGVLKLRIPRREESKPRRVDVHVG
ncbi:Hsp20/alpha crystallin family protein [Pararobbsia silviterrae]|uniref:Hsp20/alpha crystallin family protein n=1 Tax=Pararobbsia silviterrae TaxID=1792498 RepID=A0A494Y092_9BURK|nr:Hsp20/alpha crystallin family protein [Pararobbsia silviterrae]RKP55669.1 Hsp20/alpha crystallin family protein [Pararobbsia silviterrae]